MILGMSIGIFIAEVVSVLALVLEIFIYQFKGMKAIVIGQCVSNLLILINYACRGGDAGAWVCAVATLQTYLIYLLYQRKEKDIPYSFTGIFIVLYIVCSLFTFNGYLDIIPIIAALCFAVSVVQTNSGIYRVIVFISMVLWIVYDIFTASYIMIITHGIAVVSVVVGMLRHDIKDWIKKLNK